MKDYGILMSSDGPNHNVIKIKPPIIFTKENAREVIFYLKKVFSEDHSYFALLTPTKKRVPDSNDNNKYRPVHKITIV